MFKITTKLNQQDFKRVFSRLKQEEKTHQQKN
jgi:hypothetical protein